MISYPGEEHTDSVLAALTRGGREVLRIDMAAFPAQTGLAAEWGAGKPPRFALDVGGTAADLTRASAVWWRRVQPFQVDARIGGMERRHFAVSETTQAVFGVLDSLDCSHDGRREEYRQQANSGIGRSLHRLPVEDAGEPAVPSPSVR